MIAAPRFFKIHDPELCAKLHLALEERNAVYSNFSKVGNEYGFTDFRFATGNTYLSFTVRGFAMDSKEASDKVDLSCWRRILKNKGYIFVPRKTNKSFHKEVSEKLTHTFGLQWNMDHVLDELCFPNWFLSGVEDIVKAKDTYLIKTFGKFKNINSLLIEINESEYLALQGK